MNPRLSARQGLSSPETQGYRSSGLHQGLGKAGGCAGRWRKRTSFAGLQPWPSASAVTPNLGTQGQSDRPWLWATTAPDMRCWGVGSGQGRLPRGSEAGRHSGQGEEIGTKAQRWGGTPGKGCGMVGAWNSSSACKARTVDS